MIREIGFGLGHSVLIKIPKIESEPGMICTLSLHLHDVGVRLPLHHEAGLRFGHPVSMAKKSSLLLSELDNPVVQQVFDHRSEFFDDYLAHWTLLLDDRRAVDCLKCREKSPKEPGVKLARCKGLRVCID